MGPSPHVPWPEARFIGPPQGYRADVTLQREGDEVTDVWLVVSGIVTLSSTTTAAEDVIVALRGPGRMIGAVPAVLGRPSHVTAVTLSACELRAIKTADMVELERTNALVSQWLFRAQGRETETLIARLATLSGRHGHDRVASALVELFALGHRSLDDGALMLPFPLSMVGLAQIANVNRTQAHRHFRAMETTGAVARHHGRLVLPTRSPLHPRALAGRDAS